MWAGLWAGGCHALPRPLRLRGSAAVASAYVARRVPVAGEFPLSEWNRHGSGGYTQGLNGASRSRTLGSGPPAAVLSQPSGVSEAGTGAPADGKRKPRSEHAERARRAEPRASAGGGHARPRGRVSARPMGPMGPQPSGGLCFAKKGQGGGGVPRTAMHLLRFRESKTDAGVPRSARRNWPALCRWTGLLVARGCSSALVLLGPAS